MSKITEITLIPLLAPLARPYGMARGLMGSRQSAILRLRTADGAEGLGEAWGPAAVTRAHLEMLRPLLIGTDVHDVELVAGRLLAQFYHAGIQNQLVAALGAVDMAALDAVGHLHGLPVARLLGGIARTRLPVYASGGYMTAEPERDFPAMLETLAASGARAAKIKIGLGARSDAARVRSARSALGEAVLLLVDANGNYTVDEALNSMRRIADADIHWFEEPLPPQDFSGYAALRRRAPMAVATGEALYTAWDFQRLIEAGGVDVVQPDLTLCGGVRAAREIALLARLHNLRLSPHVWGGGVGLAAACHFTASLPDWPHSTNVVHPAWVEYDVGENPLRDTILRTPVRLEDGCLVLPEGAGLGVALDEDALARWRVD